MEQGIAIARWHLGETLRVLHVLDEPQEWGDARLLDNWLEKNSPCALGKTLQVGPVRNKLRRNAAVNVLDELGRVRLERHGREIRLVRNPMLAIANPANSANRG